MVTSSNAMNWPHSSTIRTTQRALSRAPPTATAVSEIAVMKPSIPAAARATREPADHGAASNRIEKRSRLTPPSRPALPGPRKARGNPRSPSPDLTGIPNEPDKASVRRALRPGAGRRLADKVCEQLRHPHVPPGRRARPWPDSRDNADKPPARVGQRGGLDRAEPRRGGDLAVRGEAWISRDVGAEPGVSVSASARPARRAAPGRLRGFHRSL